MQDCGQFQARKGTQLKFCGGCLPPWSPPSSSTATVLCTLALLDTMYIQSLYINCGWGSFWYSNCFAKWIFARRWNFCWYYFKMLKKSLDAPAFSLPRHNSSRQLPSKLPTDLLSACLIWVQCGSVVSPLHPLYDSTSAVLRQGTLCLHSPGQATRGDHCREEIIAVSRLKAWTAEDTTPGSPRCYSRPPDPGAEATLAAAHPGGPAATKHALFSDQLVSPPSQPKISLGRFLHAPGRQLLHSLHRQGIRKVSGNHLRGSTSDPSASLPRPVLGGGGGPVEAVYTAGPQPVPAWQQYSVLKHWCILGTVPVYKPLCLQ